MINILYTLRDEISKLDGVYICKVREPHNRLDVNYIAKHCSYFSCAALYLTATSIWFGRHKYELSDPDLVVKILNRFQININRPSSAILECEDEQSHNGL